jgi:hypothetical protein
VRAPGSNVTWPPLMRAGGAPLNRKSMRTAPVKLSLAPCVATCEPLRAIGSAAHPKSILIFASSPS